MRKRKATRGEVEALVELLTESSVTLAATDLPLAKEQASLARRVMMRFNIKLGYPTKSFTCHGCKSLMVPGVNARVRLGHGRPPTVRVTCLECGHINRKILRQP